jgi:hypothetical protein
MLRRYRRWRFNISLGDTDNDLAVVPNLTNSTSVRTVSLSLFGVHGALATDSAFVCSPPTSRLSDKSSSFHKRQSTYDDQDGSCLLPLRNCLSRMSELVAKR